MDVKQTQEQLNEMITETIEVEQKEERDHNFFYYDNSHEEKSTVARHLKRKVKLYTSSRLKTRNFLSNIAYNGVKKEDFFDNNFVFDMLALLTKNLNPFSLEREIADVKNREIIYMFCEECVEKTFYRHICERGNFLYLNSKNVLYPHSPRIVMDYLEQDNGNIVRLRQCFQQKKNIVQFIYSRCYPEIYSLIDKHGIEIKSEFSLAFKSWKDKKKFQLLPNQQQQQKSNLFRMKSLLKMKKFSKKKFAEKREKRKILAAKNESLKSSKKKKKEPVNEKAYWGRLNELNENFAKIKNIQKLNKNKFISLIRK